MEPPSRSTSIVENVQAERRSLSDLETEVIDLFVNGVRVLGLPKSIGEIYGLLFASPEPLSFDQILERLEISKGSTSQGLRFLRSLGAARTVYIAGTRKDFYVAETELKKLVAGFIRGELRPHLESGSDRLARLQALVESRPSDPDLEDDSLEFYQSRIGKLRIWHQRSRKLLPLIERFLS